MSINSFVGKSKVIQFPISRVGITLTAVDPLADTAVWPHNIEVCLTRVPIRKKDGYSVELIEKLAKKLKTAMARGGSVFLICYAPAEDKARPFEISRAMTTVGFKHIDSIIVERTWTPGRRAESTLSNSYDFVLHFVNGDSWKLDREPLREYMGIDDPNICPGNLWCVETGSLDEPYPIDLAELLVQTTACLPGSLLFDPFCSGTALARCAIKLGHSMTAFFGSIAELNVTKKFVETVTQNKIK
jgi:hypothetical protein